MLADRQSSFHTSVTLMDDAEIAAEKPRDTPHRLKMMMTDNNSL